MSGMHDSAPVDPLAALRAADHRPLSAVWRERLYGGVVAKLRTSGRVAVPAVLTVMLAIALGWRMFMTSGPPIEDSIPMATPPTVAISDQLAASPPAPPDSSSTAGVGLDVSDDVIVHVAGAVSRPGLVRGDVQWRVDDAVRSAGGALAAADLDRLNLAAPVLDGQRIYVPYVGENEPAVLNPTIGLTSPSTPAPVNVNSADEAMLETLPGVGPATAATIVAHRESHGNFGTVDALVAVRGIGPATLESLREHVTVG